MKRKNVNYIFEIYVFRFWNNFTIAYSFEKENMVNSDIWIFFRTETSLSRFACTNLYFIFRNFRVTLFCTCADGSNSIPIAGNRTRSLELCMLSEKRDERIKMWTEYYCQMSYSISREHTLVKYSISMKYIYLLLERNNARTFWEHTKFYGIDSITHMILLYACRQAICLS